MKSGGVGQTAIVCISSVMAIGLMVTGLSWTSDNPGSHVTTSYMVLFGVIGIGLVLGSRHLTATRKAKIELVGGEEYRRLADEYRRLADVAITAQEHLDLKLGDVSVRIDYLREQMDSLQKILKEVE